jgi:5-methylcytosine-specific restriction endonuclease McrA
MKGVSNKIMWEIYERDHYTCIYCGFDGRDFDSYMQLSIDHIRPRSSGGDHSPENLAAACRECNSLTSRMKFIKNTSREEIIFKKREQVAQRRKAYYANWIIYVAPNYLKRPLSAPT